MGRTKGSPNKTIPTLPSSNLSTEQRIQLIANLILETILLKQKQELEITKELQE